MDEKRELRKEYHLFFRHIEDKNVSRAMKQNGRIDSGCERSPLTREGKPGHREVRRGDQIRGGPTDGRQGDESARKSVRQRAGNRERERDQ